jgi:hypothetical protein
MTAFKFFHFITENEDCAALLKFWNLKVEDFVKAEGRVLESPKLRFGGGIRDQICPVRTLSGSSYHQVSLCSYLKLKIYDVSSLYYLVSDSS